MWATIFLLGCHMVCVPALVFVGEPEDRITEFEKPMWWHCQAVNGTANIEYRWEFKSQRLPRNGDQTVFPNGTLVLHRVTYDDVGTYRCTANSGDRQLKSREATLQIACMIYRLTSYVPSAPKFKIYRQWYGLCIFQS
ncbi:hypothetical protein DPMN_149809 [Dreissena polymorpha]|uniref:Ig-like domain-containing protein n=1 Tax=Dreissena polymorpha TaxID=45954 RepID=A0A9D4FGI6_DREPO|nr:hypothetical protein DPMN_149809 [Dreissena polymorpha]